MTRDGRPDEDISLKHRLLERWTARRLGTIAHERRVTAIAATLFDLTAHLHRLSPADRKLLLLGCVCHDVGRSVDEDEHPREGARMILQDNWLPITPAERRLLAYFCRYHRGTVPEAGGDAYLLPTDDRRAARLLLALLRAADALDSRSQESPRLAIALHGRRVHVTCYLNDDSAKARKAYGKRKKYRLLEELLDCRVDVDVRCGEALQTVG
ncbi:MAG TPA: HD domain-containing protein [Tepidisphaeraceae bacterium]|nr:HD domain-containing protein [Tepidisphaeraceae bacterium]